MSIPYRFRVKGFFRYEDPGRHEKEIQEQAKRDARDKARLRVEKDVFWVGLFGLVGLLFTLAQTRISTEAVKKQFELSERPWVSVDLVAIRPLVFEGDSIASVWVQFAMKNLGHSPAHSAQLRFQVVEVPDRSKGYTVQNDLCVSTFSNHESVGTRHAIMPGEQVMQLEQLKAIVPFARKKDPQIPGRSLLSVAIVGCVEYEFTFAEGFHQTGFFFDLVKLDPDEPQVWYFIELPEGESRVDHIGFRKDALGSYAY